VTRLRGQPITESAQQESAAIRAEPVPACDYHHGSTL